MNNTDKQYLDTLKKYQNAFIKPKEYRQAYKHFFGRKVYKKYLKFYKNSFKNLRWIHER